MGAYAASGTFSLTSSWEAVLATYKAAAPPATGNPVTPVPVMSLPALAGFALLLAGLGWALARKPRTL
ncbi:MAG TPA: hypothetical protein VE959_25735 [Bryobacteraceae bacterium]|nr:hypothetical protein SBA4_3330006 [Candidatus Sulfopaludibacter sp. SbA4]HYW46294.1 hypothetical protein [Bryobacteraceae bacterium]